MPATNYTPIQLYRSTTSGNVPSAANLSAGEIALNIADNDMTMYMENASGVVKSFFNNPAALKYPTADGTSGQVLQTNGAGVLSFGAAGGGANIQSFSATGTYTKPPGAKFVYVELWGAGGGGAAGAWTPSQPNSCIPGGGGGGGGAYTYRMFAAPAIGATETVTVGAGGAAGISKAPPITPYTYGTAGGAGGTTNFGTYLYAYGGAGAAGNGIPGNGPTARGGAAVANICSVLVFQTQTFASNASSSSSAAATNLFGCISGIRRTFNGIYSGGTGGASVPLVRCFPQFPAPVGLAQAGRGYLSAFGGGGGGAGASAYQNCCGVYTNTSGFVGGAGLAFGGATSPTLSLTFPNTTIACAQFGRGGGGTGTPSSFGFGGQGGNSNSGPSPVSPLCVPSMNGNAGGIAGGGGGAASLLNAFATRAANGGAGGNGYAVVYTW